MGVNNHMCLASISKINAPKLSEKTLKTSFDNNDDGCGIAYVENGTIKVHKTMNKMDHVNMYDKVYNNFAKTSPILLHYRIGTHGQKSKYNVHPFKVNDNLVFCHNGIINNVDNCKKRSDTRVFNDDVLKHLPNRFIHNKSIIKLMSDFIGQSKLIFLASDCNFKIVNQHMGHWVNNTWFSNSSYKKNTFDFGGFSSMCEIPTNKKVNQLTIYKNGFCDWCNTYTSKRHVNEDMNLCGVCNKQWNGGI